MNKSILLKILIIVIFAASCIGISFGIVYFILPLIIICSITGLISFAVVYYNDVVNWFNYISEERKQKETKKEDEDETDEVK